MPTQQHEQHYNAIINNEERMGRLRRRRRPLWRLFIASVWDFLRLVHQARGALTGFVLLAIVNSCYLVFIYSRFHQDLMPPGQESFNLYSALYETMRMMALETDLRIPPDDVFGEILFFMVPLLGLALVFQSVLNFGRLLLDKSTRREEWQISLASTYRDHVIVCGLGSVAYRVVLNLLESDHGVVVIEIDWESEFVEQTLALGVPVIHGNARKSDVLRHAGIKRARSLVACLHEDLANIEITLAARRQRSDLPVVLRIFNDELDTNLEQSFGRNSAFSASALAAPTLAAAAVGRSIAHVLPLPHGFGSHDSTPRFLGVLQLTITADSELRGMVPTIEDHWDVRLLRHVKAQGTAKTRSSAQGTEHLKTGDTVAFLGAMDTLEQVRQLNHGLGNDTSVPLRAFSHAPLPGNNLCYDRVIVCGLGKVGYRVVNALHQMNPRPDIVVISNNHDSPFIEDVRDLGITVRYGDARKAEVLQQAGIDHACSVVAATSNDLINLQIGLTARRLHGDIDMVLRVFSDVLAERLESLFGVHTTFSTSALAAPTLAAAAAVRGIDYAIEIAEHILSTITLRAKVGDAFTGKTVDAVRATSNMLVIALRRKGQAVLPLKLDTAIRAGDDLVVLADVQRLEMMHLSLDQAIVPTLTQPHKKPHTLPADAATLQAKHRDVPRDQEQTSTS